MPSPLHYDIHVPLGADEKDWQHPPAAVGKPNHRIAQISAMSDHISTKNVRNCNWVL